MGKYMKKAKTSAEVSAMEAAPHHSPLGVRTRARTLALQRLSPAAAPPPHEGSSYLQLRSRRLEKPPAPTPKEPPCSAPAAPSPLNLNPRSGPSAPGAGAVNCEASPETDGGVEVSFGENVLDVEPRSRETTPCSLIMDSETVGTPGSTTRPTYSTANRRARSSAQRGIPTALEIEEFLSGLEQLQQKKFAEKYNFDAVNERPLPGRYEWVKLDD